MKLLARIGARGVLALLGGMATLAAATCAYGMPSCTTDKDCKNPDFPYCTPNHFCERPPEPDAGTPVASDAGATNADTGQ
ncbi:MAG: hypothetical protein QM765_18755 [Myxococcales bacterium]